VITAGVVALRRRWLGGLVGWVWYVLFLVPVSLMAHAGPQLVADRYAYLPTLGLLVPLGAALAAAHLRWRGGAGRRVLRLAVLALVLTLAVLTWAQQAVWRDTRSLWTHAVKVSPDCAVCHTNVGLMLLEAGQPAAALGHFTQALELRPDRVGSYRSLGLALEALGRRDEAIEAYRRGLELTPGALAIRLSLASALLAAGRLDEVIQTVDGAWRFYEAAALVPYFVDATRHRPEAPVPRLGLVHAWRALGETDRAQAELEVLRRLHPDLAALAAPGRSS
jgi:tetratricopeptide (TPR) repeat protein